MIRKKSIFRRGLSWVRRHILLALFYLFRVFRIQRKVVATTFRGRKYGDNTQFIVEELHRIEPSLDIVWLKRSECNFTVPEYIRPVPYYSLRAIYERVTAKVWLNTHRFEVYTRKRNGQYFIETWHGGLGIKKIEGDYKRVASTKGEINESRNTSLLADLFISNSDHLSAIYRRAFDYKGKILKCGYPKNDILFKNNDYAKTKVRDALGIDSNTKLIVYAPTFRDSFECDGILDPEKYDVDFERLYSTINDTFDGDWLVVVKWHPLFVGKCQIFDSLYNNHIINGTNYPDMQELIFACDAFISDYSSCIFDAAVMGVPCFTYANDFEEYKSERGVYFEMEELPFPYATTNDELMANIRNFDYKNYCEKWEKFKIRTGLYETGHASNDIARIVISWLNGENPDFSKFENFEDAIDRSEE